MRCRTATDANTCFNELNRSAAARTVSSMKRSAYVSLATGLAPVASAYRAASIQ